MPHVNLLFYPPNFIARRYGIGVALFTVLHIFYPHLSSSRFGLGDTDSLKDRDSGDLDLPVAKKPKIDVEPEPEGRTVPRGFCLAGERIILIGKLTDPEYRRHRKVFDDQFEDNEGF